MDLLYPYGGALVAPFAAIYIASILSRFQMKRGKRPGWSAGLVSLTFGILVGWVCSFQLDTFRLWRWGNVGGKVDFVWLLGTTAFLSLLTSIIPSSFVVDRYQKRYDKMHQKI